MERMGVYVKQGVTSVETVLVMTVSFVWGGLGAVVAPTYGVPLYIYDFAWCASGAFIAQGFWQLSKRPPWQVGVGVAGASGLLAGASAWLIDFFFSTIGYPLGQAGVFMASIALGALGLERMILIGEKAVTLWTKIRLGK